MDRLNEILHRKYYVREIILLVFIVLGLLYLSIYTSFAIFEKTVEKTGIVAFEASPISLSVSSSETSYQVSSDGTYGTITVPAGETKTFDITIKNETSIDVKYKTWYRFTSGVTILDVEVGISSRSENENTSTLTKSGTNGDNKIVRVVIANNSTQSATIDIGVQGGYVNNEVALNSGNGEMTIITEIPSFTDTSGANEPVLADGMIPVVYDETKEAWLRANTEAGWYAYQDQIWANAVTTTSTNRETYLSDEHIGKEIPMDEINSMWVWIPRFRYNIPTISNGNNLTNPPQINVEFEPGTETNGVTEATYRTGISAGATNSLYYTHPSFRNVNNIEYGGTSLRGAWNEEITGYWAAKFNVTSSMEIKPNGTLLTTYDLVNKFTRFLSFAGGTFTKSTGVVTFTANTDNNYGLNTETNTTNTHMMKNTEWGAVAILSQSQYGKMGNSDYTEANKEVYQNLSTVTGKSNGAPSGTTSVECDYNDITNRGNGTGACGAGASTTGTIYGIYDMHGPEQQVMGFYPTANVTSVFTTLPSTNYYDKYSGVNATSSQITLDKVILGDATWETLGWYSDHIYASGGLLMDYPLYTRGTKGVFMSDPVNYSRGGAGRVVLIP